MPTKVGGQNVRMIIGSGSSVTILSAKKFYAIPRQIRHQLTKYAGKLTLADGSDCSVSGSATIEFEFEKTTIRHYTLVADIESDGLIGGDFLQQHGCNIDYKGKTMVIEEKRMRFEEILHETVYQVKAKAEIIVPAHTTMEIPGEMAQKSAKIVAVLEPVTSEDHKFLVGNVVVDTIQNTIPVHLMNAGDESIMVHTGDNNALAHPVEKILSIFPSVRTNSIRPVSLISPIAKSGRLNSA